MEKHYFKFRSGPHSRDWSRVIAERIPEADIVFVGTEHVYFGFSWPTADPYAARQLMSDRFRSSQYGNFNGITRDDFEHLGTKNPFPPYADLTICADGEYALEVTDHQSRVTVSGLWVAYAAAIEETDSASVQPSVDRLNTLLAYARDKEIWAAYSASCKANAR